MSKNKCMCHQPLDKTLNTIYQTIRSISNTPREIKNRYPHCANRECELLRDIFQKIDNYLEEKLKDSENCIPMVKSKLDKLKELKTEINKSMPDSNIVKNTTIPLLDLTNNLDHTDSDATVMIEDQIELDNNLDVIEYQNNLKKLTNLNDDLSSNKPVIKINTNCNNLPSLKHQEPIQKLPFISINTDKLQPFGQMYCNCNHNICHSYKNDSNCLSNQFNYTYQYPYWTVPSYQPIDRFQYSYWF